MRLHGDAELTRRRIEGDDRVGAVRSWAHVGEPDGYCRGARLRRSAAGELRGDGDELGDRAVAVETHHQVAVRPHDDRRCPDAAVRGLQHVLAAHREAAIAEARQLADDVLAVADLLEHVASVALDAHDPERRVTVGPADEHATLGHRPPVARRTERTAGDGRHRPAEQRCGGAGLDPLGGVGERRQAGRDGGAVELDVDAPGTEPSADGAARRGDRQHGAGDHGDDDGGDEQRPPRRTSRRRSPLVGAVDDEKLSDTRQHSGEAVVIERHVSPHRSPPPTARRAGAPSLAPAAT